MVVLNCMEVTTDSEFSLNVAKEINPLADSFGIGEFIVEHNQFKDSILVKVKKHPNMGLFMCSANKLIRKEFTKKVAFAYI